MHKVFLVIFCLGIFSSCTQKKSQTENVDNLVAEDATLPETATVRTFKPDIYADSIAAIDGSAKISL